MAAKKSGLGRGLGALLSDSPSKESKTLVENRNGLDEIQLSNIEVNPFQPRTDFDQESLNELAESIKVQGIIQPITVRKLAADKYQLISGERRFQASKLIDNKTIPAYIRGADDQQMLEMALIENIQRENLNAMEIALSYQRLLTECNLKQEELGDRVGKNRTTVNNYLRLLKLPPDIQGALRDGLLSMGHARALLAIEDISEQIVVFQRILKESLSVRKVEQIVRELSEINKDKPEPSAPNPELVRLQDQLSSHFGTKIKIKGGNNDKGEIAIPYQSTSELNRILEILDI